MEQEIQDAKLWPVYETKSLAMAQIYLGDSCLKWIEYNNLKHFLQNAQNMFL